MELSEVKQKIQDLINKAVEDNNQQKNTLSFLFDKLAEVKELETIDRLRQFQGGNKYLLAYLTYKSIVRANFQPELTENTKYDEDEQGQDKLLNAIYADVEQFEKKSEPKPLSIEQLSNHLSDRQLLTILSERMGAGAVKRELTQFGKFIIIEDEQGILKVDLERGILEPDPAQELLKKHGIIDKEGVAIKLSDDFNEFAESVKFPSENSIIPITWFEVIKWIEKKLETGELYLYGHDQGKFKIDNTCEPIIRCDIRTKRAEGDFADVLDNRHFIKILSHKIKSGSIDREWNGAYLARSGSSAGSKEGGSKYLFYKDDRGSIKLNLWNGKLTEKDTAEAIAEAIHGKDDNQKN